MFDQLSEKLQHAFRNISGKGKLTEDNISEALKEIRLALLEADVNFKVVKSFVAGVKDQALGQEVTKGLDPSQQLIKIVNDQLIEILGGATSDLQLEGSAPQVIMMVGLQGSGKTTSSAKLARYLTEQGKHPMLVPCDVYRPAAILQLQTVGEQVDVPVFDSKEFQKPIDIVRGATREAKNTGRDVLIVDTAGRLHIDEHLMDELKELKLFLQPSEILFVADAMTGQDAVQSAKAFHQALDVSGVILTKLDGDTRGGAALSVKSITGKPIKFVGMGEKLDALERFHPDRMASRILGMGDVLSLIEKVQSKVDEDEARKLQERMMKNQFTLDDFNKSLQQIDRMGDLGSLMKLVPGMGKLKNHLDANAESQQLRRMRAIISSMTRDERHNHAILNQRRKTRIAKGSGTSIQDVNGMLNQFMQMKKMMGMMTKPGKLGKLTQMFKRAGLGDFAKSMLPGLGKGQLPTDMNEDQLRELLESSGGNVTPEMRQQLGIGSPGQGTHISRPKKNRKKQKQKRKKGRKRN